MTETPTEKTPRRRTAWLFNRPVLYFVLPIIVYVLTSLPKANLLTPFLAIGLLVLLLVYRFTPRVPRALRTATWILLVLSLVGSTGWFYSPFFFGLYLAAIALGFVYTAGVAIAFTIALIILFAFSVGEVNVAYDFLTLLSLLTVIPLTLGLRRSFLLVQQERKGILILEGERHSEGVTTLDTILQNRINRIGILLRQPITYIKQGLALLHDGKLSPPESQDVVHRMQRSTDELFTLVKDFERGTTKNDLLSGGTTTQFEQPLKK